MTEILWLVAIIVFIVLEAVTYQMVSAWFIIGAIGGLIAAMLGTSFWVQMTIFILLSVVLLICFRPIAIKKLKTDYKTNADAVIGKKATITCEVNNIKGTGAAKLDGLVWTARAEDDTVFNVGDVVEVTRIEGVKLIVK